MNLAEAFDAAMRLNPISCVMGYDDGAFSMFKVVNLELVEIIDDVIFFDEAHRMKQNIVIDEYTIETSTLGEPVSRMVNESYIIKAGPVEFNFIFANPIVGIDG